MPLDQLGKRHRQTITPRGGLSRRAASIWASSAARNGWPGFAPGSSSRSIPTSEGGDGWIWSQRAQTFTQGVRVETSMSTLPSSRRSWSSPSGVSSGPMLRHLRSEAVAAGRTCAGTGGSPAGHRYAPPPASTTAPVAAEERAAAESSPVALVAHRCPRPDASGQRGRSRYRHAGEPARDHLPRPRRPLDRHRGHGRPSRRRRRRLLERPERHVLLRNLGGLQAAGELDRGAPRR